MHNVLVAASALLLAHCGASPIAALKARQSCPEVHVFGARETTAPAGYGTASVVVDLVLGAYAGATSEAIDYPAWYGASATSRVTLYCN
jgi:acetylxylan esterase